MLNSLQASQSFAVMFPVTSTFKFAAVAMEIKKKGGILKIFWFLSSNFMKHYRNIHRSVWKLLACWYNSKWHYRGNRGTKIMGWGDVRYCFAMAILVTSSWLLSGDVLLFYVSFSLLLRHPECSRVTYCYSTFLYYYYYYYYYYYSSTHFCPLYFSEMPWTNFMKACRNIICHVKLCCWGLIFSKWLPLPWKRPKC